MGNLLVEWHAYYFDRLDNRSPAVRIVTIEADNEDQAGKIAIAQMGRSTRVEVTRQLWGSTPADLEHDVGEAAGRPD